MGSIRSSDEGFVISSKNVDPVTINKLLARADIQNLLQEDSVVVDEASAIASFNDDHQPSEINIYGNYNSDCKLCSVELVFKGDDE